MEENLARISESIPSIARHDPDLVRWQLTTEDIIELYEHSLRGEVWNPEAAKWKPLRDPLVNDDGIFNILSCMRAHLHKCTILSNLKDDEVKRLCRESTAVIINKLADNYKRWNINVHDLDGIATDYDHIIFVTTKRSMNEGERNFLKPVERRVESISAEKQRGIHWPSIVPTGGGRNNQAA